MLIVTDRPSCRACCVGMCVVFLLHWGCCWGEQLAGAAAADATGCREGRGGGGHSALSVQFTPCGGGGDWEASECGVSGILGGGDCRLAGNQT